MHAAVYSMYVQVCFPLAGVGALIEHIVHLSFESAALRFSVWRVCRVRYSNLQFDIFYTALAYTTPTPLHSPFARGGAAHRTGYRTRKHNGGGKVCTLAQHLSGHMRSNYRGAFLWTSSVGFCFFSLAHQTPSSSQKTCTRTRARAHRRRFMH